MIRLVSVRDPNVRYAPPRADDEIEIEFLQLNEKGTDLQKVVQVKVQRGVLKMLVAAANLE